MRKYYYYTYETRNSFGYRICYSDSGEFDIAFALEILYNMYGSAVITNWHEISSAQYEKLSKIFNNNNK